MAAIGSPVAGDRLSKVEPSAASTNFAFETRTPSDLGEIKTVTLVDFGLLATQGNYTGAGVTATSINPKVGAGNNSIPRIQWAYGTLGPWLFGQYNSAWADPLLFAPDIGDQSQVGPMQTVNIRLSPEQVPDIDVGPLFEADARARSRVVETVGRACREPGFFRVHGTGIAPGVIDTPFVAGALAEPGTRQRLEGLTVFNRLGTAEEIAEAIAWLLSPAASYVHGATLVADGGGREFPYRFYDPDRKAGLRVVRAREHDDA